VKVERVASSRRSRSASVSVSRAALRPKASTDARSVQSLAMANQRGSASSRMSSWRRLPGTRLISAAARCQAASNCASQPSRARIRSMVRTAALPPSPVAAVMPSPPADPARPG